MKKTLALLLTACMSAFVIAGCGSATTSESSSDSAEATTTSDSSDVTYTIGICQLVQHDALDAASQGFMDALTELLGDAVTFDYQDASGDSATCATIVNQFVSNDVDLIMANATAPLQAAAAATDTIPILGTSVTDYATALDISDWTGVTGVNISGTSDCAPLTDQAAMIAELFPDATTVGMLYCSAEPNSEYQVSVVTEALEELGYTCVNYSFADSNDIASVATNACANCDVIYIPTDNTAASATSVIDNVCRAAGVPVVAGEEGICQGCGVATLSISYYDLGYQTGLMAYEILVNGADVSTMTIQYASDVTKEYNIDICADLGIEVPSDYEGINYSAGE